MSPSANPEVQFSCMPASTERHISSPQPPSHGRPHMRHGPQQHNHYGPTPHPCSFSDGTVHSLTQAEIASRPSLCLVPCFRLKHDEFFLNWLSLNETHDFITEQLRLASPQAAVAFKRTLHDNATCLETPTTSTERSFAPQSWDSSAITGQPFHHPSFSKPNLTDNASMRVDPAATPPQSPSNYTPISSRKQRTASAEFQAGTTSEKEVLSNDRLLQPCAGLGLSFVRLEECLDHFHRDSDATRRANNGDEQSMSKNISMGGIIVDGFSNSSPKFAPGAPIAEHEVHHTPALRTSPEISKSRFARSDSAFSASQESVFSITKDAHMMTEGERCSETKLKTDEDTDMDAEQDEVHGEDGKTLTERQSKTVTITSTPEDSPFVISIPPSDFLGNPAIDLNKIQQISFPDILQHPSNKDSSSLQSNIRLKPTTPSSTLATPRPSLSTSTSASSLVSLSVSSTSEDDRDRTSGSTTLGGRTRAGSLVEEDEQAILSFLDEDAENRQIEVDVKPDAKVRIPRFHFPRGKPAASGIEGKKKRRDVVYAVHSSFLDTDMSAPLSADNCTQNRPTRLLDENSFVPVTLACGLPRYCNIAFFRKCIKISEAIQNKGTTLQDELDVEDRNEEKSGGASRNYLDTERRRGWTGKSIAFVDFARAWMYLTDRYHDENSLLFAILERNNICVSDLSPSLARLQTAGSRRGSMSTENDLSEAFSASKLQLPGEHAEHLKPRDFASILEDIVFNHAGMDFLIGNSLFQERYAETVIVRIFYEFNRSWSGTLSRSEFRRSAFHTQLRRLEFGNDLNGTRNIFSYKHFYVIYCKFWELDRDHDLKISGRDLSTYSNGCLQSRVVKRIMQGYGKHTDLETAHAARNRRAMAVNMSKLGVKTNCSASISRSSSAQSVLSGASSKSSSVVSSPSIKSKRLNSKARISYRDFIWFFLSDIDKSTPTAIEYWFRILDTDGDGILSLYEMELWWRDQTSRFSAVAYEGPSWADAMCQMMDCIKPSNPLYITVKDIKKSGQSTIFIEYFVHVQKHMQNEQRYQQEIKHIQRARALERVRPANDFTARRITDVPPPEDDKSEWEVYADDQYEYLVMEEQQTANRRSTQDSWSSDDADSSVSSDEELENDGDNAIQNVSSDSDSDEDEEEEEEINATGFPKRNATEPQNTGFPALITETPVPCVNIPPCPTKSDTEISCIVEMQVVPRTWEEDITEIEEPGERISQSPHISTEQLERRWNGSDLEDEMMADIQTN